MSKNRTRRNAWKMLCGVFFFTLLLMSPAHAAERKLSSETFGYIQAACTDPTWTASGVYTQGNRVTYNSKIYEARWWTTNENPELKSGPWDVWKLIGPCGGSNANPSA